MMFKKVINHFKENTQHLCYCVLYIHMQEIIGQRDSLFHTPDLSHISYNEYEKMYVYSLICIIRYEPDQDSFLFLDSLEKEYSFLIKKDPFFILEIGPGSGIISTFLTHIISWMFCIVIM